MSVTRPIKRAQRSDFGKKRGPHMRTKMKELRMEIEYRNKAEWKMQRLKPWDVSLRQHVGKMLDNMEVDPLETGAVLGMTYMLYNNVAPIIAGILRIESKDIKNEIAKLAISYTVAYIVVKNAGMLITKGIDTLTDIFAWLIIGKALSSGIEPSLTTSPGAPFGVPSFWTEITVIPWPIPEISKEKAAGQWKWLTGQPTGLFRAAK